MARLRCSVTTEGEIALAAATEKTTLQVAAPANQRVAIIGWGVSFDGTIATAEPVDVVLEEQSDAGTMSAATEVVDNGGSETPQAVAQKNATVEPTTTSTYRRQKVHPQTSYERVFGPDEEIIVEGGTRFAVVCTAPAGVNVAGFISWEE